MTSAHPRGTYLAADPAGWTYGGPDTRWDGPAELHALRIELDARIKKFMAAHPDVTSKADAEQAIRVADRERAERFLVKVRRGGLAALLGGGRDGQLPIFPSDGDSAEPAPQVSAEPNPLDVACKHCHAGVGQPCHNTAGPLRAGFHDARLDAAAFAAARKDGQR